MSEISTVTMPKWGMEMAEGEIAEWYVQPGDRIAEGDDLVDVETSKIVNTVTSPASGEVKRLLAKQGETIPVGGVLAVIAPAKTRDQEIDDFLSTQVGAGGESALVAPEETGDTTEKPGEFDPDGAAAAPDHTAPAENPSMTTAAPEKGDSDRVVAATPVARRVARQQDIDLTRVNASGRHGRVTLRDLEAALQASGRALEKNRAPARPDAGPKRDDNDVPATPVARRLARDNGVNLLDCRASGRHGRVSKADVEALVALQSAAAVPATAAGTAEAPVFEARPLSGKRRTIATRLQASKRDAPHFRVQVEVEVDALIRLREELNRRHTEQKISLNDLLIKACACALQAVPALNVQFDGETVQQFRDADIAVAVALDEGLITPIVRRANRKGVLEISGEVRDLVTRARIGTLRPEEFQGGSFSLSNLGMYGVGQFDAIINSPQGAILAAGACEQRPVVKNGECAVATVMTVSLSSDHRVIDGATAARFVTALRGFLETPATMLA